MSFATRSKRSPPVAAPHHLHAVEKQLKIATQGIDDDYNAGKPAHATTKDLSFMLPPLPGVPPALLKDQDAYVGFATGLLKQQPGFTHHSVVERVQVLSGEAATTDVQVTLGGLKGFPKDSYVLPVTINWERKNGDWLASTVRFLAPIDLAPAK